MKCKILTIHHIHNFGSVSQAYALQHFLLQQGYDAQIVDYRPGYYETGRNKVKTLLGKAINLKAYLVRKRKFEHFVQTYENLSLKRFTSCEELEHSFKNAEELWIVGGDQLWNNYHPCGQDDAYKLTFTGSGRKLAYGTSMGRDNFTQEELEILAQKVQDFQTIMLREKCTVNLLDKYTTVPVHHVIDPVGLLEPEEFLKIAKKPNLDEPYAVMYLADSGPLLDEAVDKLSKQMGLKIVHICGFRQKCFCDHFEKDVGPEEILGYIANAQFVLSASFHATMFSLMFNKPFASLLPGTHTNARIEDLLQYVGLENRILRTAEDLNILGQHIDYTCPNSILKQWKETSRALLLQAIEKETEE